MGIERSERKLSKKDRNKEIMIISKRNNGAENEKNNKKRTKT